MAESLLDDLQYVQLMVKEQHRKKRALMLKLKKPKHSKLKLKYKKKYNKYYIQLEIKSIYDNNDILIDIEDDIITYNNTVIYAKPKQKDENNQQKDENIEENNEYNLKQCFEAIEYDLYNNKKKIINLKFPRQFCSHMTSLYETTIKKDISGLLNSARYWTVNKNHIHKGIEGQAVVIGSYLHEVINILSNIIIDCPIDIIYIISELVGNAIIWLRRPGISLFKWSAKNTIQNTIQNEFYFSGYIDHEWCNKLKELLNQNCTQYLDLDWCFIVFLLLGLIPKNQYFRWYFNQKLLSAIPGTYPFKLLLKN